MGNGLGKKAALEVRAKGVFPRDTQTAESRRWKTVESFSFQYEVVSKPYYPASFPEIHA